MSRPRTPRVAGPGERLHRFHGGLRLRHNKQVSCVQPLRRPPLPARLTVPLLQHRGRPAKALVRPGQPVLKGERIGEAPGPGAGAGAHVHAPTSGTVVALEALPMAHASGQDGPCIVIAPNGDDRWCERRPLPDWRSAEPSAILRHARTAGIVGLGGAVYPTDEKAGNGASVPTPIHTLILNGAECEPYIACDEMLMREAPGRVLEGALMLGRAVGAERVVLAFEDPMQAARGALEAAAAALGPEAPELVGVPVRYPEGGERQLIETLTGEEVPDGGLPRDLGLLVHNVATAAAVRDAVIDGTPLIERVVTVTGNGVRSPCNLVALIGTPVSELVAAAGGYTEDVARLVVGGPMMGYPLASDDEPVVKATNCLLALDAADVRPTQPEMPCIRCGDCVPVCPARLLPQELQFYARAGQWDEVAALGVTACIECGCCDHVCPSHIPLASWFRHAKGELRNQARERAAADHARSRFEAREARQEQQKQAKAERLARRKQKLADQAGRKAQIQAALERAAKARGEPDS